MTQLFAILRTLNKHAYKLLLVPALCMVLIHYMTSDTPKKYKTEAKLYLNLQEGKATSLSDEDLKQYQVQTYFTNTVELLKSKRTHENVKAGVLMRAVSDSGFFRAGNKELMKYKAAVLLRLASYPGTPLDPTAFPDSVMTRFINYHQISGGRLSEMVLSFRIGDSNFMKVELTENLAEKTKELAELFIEALVNENQDLARNKIKSHKNIIEALVRQAKIDLDAKIEKLEQFKVGNNIINLGEHTKAIVVYLVQLEGQRANLQATVAAGTKGKQEVLSTVENGNEIILDVSGQSEILGLREQLRDMNKKMLERAFANNTIVSDERIYNNLEATRRQIESKILELTRKTSFDPTRVQMDLVSKYVNYDLEAETSADMIDILNAEIERVTTYSRRFAPFESTISAFEQEISTAQNVYLVLLNKLNLTQTIEFGTGENIIEVIDPPYLPLAPEPSKKMMIVAGGGISVFTLMAAVFIIIQLLDASITSVEKFESLSKLPVVAAFPDQTLRKNKSHLLTSVDLVRSQQVFKLANVIRTRCISENGILLLTSSQQGEGKHYIASEILKALIQTGHRVLVVDADWMSPFVHDNFLNYKEQFNGARGIMNQDQLTADLERWKEEFDLVIVITSPINLSAEAEFWMERCQHVLYVFKSNRVMTRVDRRVEQMMLATRLQFLGTVVNRIAIDNMEDYLGEIPRKRIFFRILIKKLLTRDF